MTEIDATTKAAILRSLASYDHPRIAVGDVAHRYDLTAQEVIDIATGHGFPRQESMRRAADILDGKVQPQRPTMAIAGPAPAPSAPAEPSRHLADGLIARAAKSHKARTRKLGEKVAGLLEDLRTSLDAEKAEAEERARVEAERAKARSEVERLRKQLAEAEARLGKKPSTAKSGSSAKEIRSWARANGVDCPPVGRVPASVVAAYDEAQRKAAS